MNGLNKAIGLAGGLTALADALGTTKGVVFQWRQRGQVPAEYCPAIERLLNGAVLCEELNNKVDWAYLRAAAHPSPEPDECLSDAELAREKEGVRLLPDASKVQT